MNRSISSILALLISIFLITEGIWGEFSDVIFVVLTTNRIRASIHILLGLIGIITALKGGARMFLVVVGAIILLVGVLWFIPTTSSLMVDLLAVNRPVAILNTIVGIVALLVGLSDRRERRFSYR